MILADHFGPETVTGLVFMILYLHLPYLKNQVIWCNENINHCIIYFSHDGVTKWVNEVPLKLVILMSIGTRTINFGNWWWCQEWGISFLPKKWAAKHYCDNLKNISYYVCFWRHHKFLNWAKIQKQNVKGKGWNLNAAWRLDFLERLTKLSHG